MVALRDSDAMTLLVCSDSAAFTAEAFRALGAAAQLRVLAAASSRHEAAAQLRDLRPDAVVVDDAMEGGAGLDVAAYLVRVQPATPAILCSERPDMALWRRAASLGVRGPVKSPPDGLEVAEVAREAIEEERRRMEDVSARLAPEPGQKHLEERPRGPAGLVVRQEVVAVYSPCGGVGKTTVAVSLAASAAAQKGVPLRVCLVDADVTRAAATGQLGFVSPPGASLADWAEADPGRTGARDAEQLLVQHRCGLWLVPGPPLPVQGLVDVGADAVSNCLAVLRRHFDLIVVDTCLAMLDCTLAALEDSTKIIVVVTPDLTVLRDARKLGATFDELGLDRGKACSLLNRVPKGPGIDLREAMSLVPFPLLGQVPEDPAVLRAVNRGDLAALKFPESAFARAVLAAGGKLVPVFGGKRRGGGILARLRGERRRGSATARGSVTEWPR